MKFSLEKALFNFLLATMALLTFLSWLSVVVYLGVHVGNGYAAAVFLTPFIIGLFISGGYE
jgi:hypothetical protein